MSTDWSTGQLPRPEGVGASIRRVLDHIEENFAAPLPLSELADIAGLSLHRLVTVFRSQVRHPAAPVCVPGPCAACAAAAAAGLPAASVALDSGFCDQSHLSRHFKRQCGVTPGYFALVSRPRTPEASPCA